MGFEWQPQEEGHKHADMLKMGSHPGDTEKAGGGRVEETEMQESTNGQGEQGGSMERSSLWGGGGVGQDRLKTGRSQERRQAGVHKNRDIEGWEQRRATEFSRGSKAQSLLFKIPSPVKKCRKCFLAENSFDFLENVLDQKCVITFLGSNAK